MVPEGKSVVYGDVTKSGGEFKNGTRGLKARSSSPARNAALEGPLFHGIIGGIAAPLLQGTQGRGWVRVGILRLRFRPRARTKTPQDDNTVSRRLLFVRRCG